MYTGGYWEPKSVDTASKASTESFSAQSTHFAAGFLGG